MIRLLLTSGRGPAECRIALARTLDALASEAEAAELDLDVATGTDPDGYGPASAITLLEGPGADAFAAAWVGSILWVARSPLRPHHKRKNWFIAVSRLAARPIEPARLDTAQVRFEAFQGGGPGGQHQNKTASAIRAVHMPTGRAVVVRNGRSQHANKAMALKRLDALLKVDGELAALANFRTIHSGHNQLERGRPVRTFQGEDFRPR